MYLIDGHMHLEYGNLTKEYVLEFVKEAKRKGINKIQILDHTHRFKEFEECYEELKVYDLQRAWLENKEKKFINSVEEFINLMKEIKKEDLGIEIEYGLEVCYSPKSEEKLRSILNRYKFDFLIGSIHSIDGILYDMNFSKELLFDKFAVDHIYRRYYELNKDLIRSKLFTQLGHPDQIKLFGHYPSYDLKNTYQEIAKLLKENNMKIESNTGAHYRYGVKDIGTNKQFLKILLDEGVEVITASDAHHPEHVGNFIREAQDIIDELRGN